ncbi:HU family DNA-binding protein (plasmid) [Aliarcobacter lanthieri]|uniref:HU family DNA-binding protein n=1 Tax=Aliarcobacter lanthieri TaxID=1355374 RepID=UPI003AAF7922
MKDKNMKKDDFVSKITEITGGTKKETAETLNALVTVITEALKNNDSVQLQGLGIFSTRIQGARVARIPGSDKTINVPEKKVPAFKISKTLKDNLIAL